MAPPGLAIKAESASRGRSFPTPFKCSGDFCGFALQLNQTDPLAAHRNGRRRAAAPPPQAAAATALSLLFAKEELRALGDSNVDRLVSAMEMAQSVSKSVDGRPIQGEELRVITYKSIALAKGNHEHMQKVLQHSELLQNSPTKARQSHVLSSTQAQGLRESSRTRLFGEMEGVANYYRQVRVCSDCYTVYALLDLARQMIAGGSDSMQKHQQSKRKRHHMSQQKRAAIISDGPIGPESQEKEIVLRKDNEITKQTLSAVAQSSADFETRQPEDASLLPSLGSNTNWVRSTTDISKAEGEIQSHLESSSKQTVSMPFLQSTEAKTGNPSVSAKPTTAHLSATKLRQTKQEQQKLLRSNDTFVGMDKYLRGTSKSIEATPLAAGHIFGGKASGDTCVLKGLATVLLVSFDTMMSDDLHRMILMMSSPTLEIKIESMTDGRQALRTAQEFDYDVILVERNLAENDMTGLEFSRLLRQSQLKRGLKVKATKATVILCVSSQTTSSDLQLYKDSGMDGCIGKPLNTESLHYTLQAALRCRSLLSSNEMTAASTRLEEVTALTKTKRDQQVRQNKSRRRLDAANSLAMPNLADMDARDDYVHGVFQMDSETAIPFCVMGGSWMSANDTDATDSNEAFFNLVVVHDLFDTWERLKILLQPLITRYRGRVQALLWNYPGQAYTSWRRGTKLNNTFHVACLSALLNHVTGASGGDRFLRVKPYHLVGIGNGGNIAASFCCSAKPRDINTRSLILLNGFAYIDAQLAQFLHDTAKVLACTPESRPDLPVYFHARFLFSAAYLARVSTPLALNLYTAVLNPITLQGRQALVLGALAHQDLRSDLKHLRVPLISICSTQNALVEAGSHAETILAMANLELVNSIGKALQYRRRKSSQQHNSERGKRPSCVIWLAGGHEALQERKQDVLLLLEQLVTGFHEVNDAPHRTSRKQLEQQPDRTKSRCEDEHVHHGVKENHQKNTKQERKFEDAFIDRVLTTVNDVVPPAVGGSDEMTRTPSSQQYPGDGTQWRLHQQQLAEQVAHDASSAGIKGSAVGLHSNSNQHGSPNRSKLIALTTWDPSTPAFERISANVVYQPGAGSKIYPLIPEVKEYMGWRVRRNQKRLQRMGAMARIIQRAFRAFYARTLAHRLHRERCAVHLQRLWRARMARKRYKGLKREDWAVRLLQRHWRGKMGRTSYKQRVLEYLSALDIQRIARGWLARRYVVRRLRRIYESAVEIQRLMRRYVARSKMFRQRHRRNAATNIQKVFRGLLGRRRFSREREKFLFSTTQSQGLTFGKQLLLEYKVFGTKLQSDVALLAREKSDVEAEAEKLVKEICEFDEGVRLLEAELLSLGQAEADSNAPGGAIRTLDETAKWALREQKMRLDREFSQMLAQIAQRREKLATLEETLARVDQERLKKEEELKALERKLVLLLEEQQKELSRIREKQEALLPSTKSPVFRTVGGSPVVGSPTPLSPSPSALASPAPQLSQGYSHQQREEAASLMESTETMMKFGFMSMSMTYFSSMNMVRAMRKIGAHHLTLDSAAAVSQQRWPENSAAETPLNSALGSMSPATFQASIPPGSFPGQQPLQITAWSVSDVGRWLDTLALGQYKRAFADATVDGALLLYLTDDDLRHTLGMEHRLHRKKVITTVEEMRVRERDQIRRLYGDNPGVLVGAPVIPEAVLVPNNSPVKQPTPSAASSIPIPVPISTAGPSPAPKDPPAGGGRVVVPFNEICSLVRHGKVKQLREALQDLPERRFDPLTVMTQFAPGTGTIYSDQLEKSAFHINKSDDKGNSPLLMAAQNNHLKVAQLLLSKGANPDHQNGHGHTAGHYAMAYSFFDLGAWLLDPDKGGGRDDLLNENGLTAYDGLN